MALVFELAGSQIDGARDYQEDAFLITNLTDANGNPSALVVVADGMGGHAAGNVASNMAVQAFNKHVSANYPCDNIAEILEQAVVMANNSIKETMTETPALQGMGCTIVAAILEQGKITWASVGDSHLYLVRNRELIKKNADHSYGGFLDRMEAEGTPVEPEPGLSRNMLMSAVTGEDINEIDVNQEPFELEAGDRVIICSDGLDTLSAGKIIQFSEWSDSPKECSDALMQAVEDANMPRQDNTTAVVVNVKDTAAPAVVEEPETDSEESEVGESTDDNEAVMESTMGDADVPETAAEPEPEPAAPAPQPEPEPQPEPVASAPAADGEPKSKAGMFIGIAAALIIVIGAGFFVMSGDKKKPADIDSTTMAEEPAIAEADDELVAETVEAVETETDTSTSAEEGVEQAEETVAETAPVAEETPSPTVEISSDNTFRDKLKSGGNGPEMVIVPAGKFLMGSKTSRYTEETPQHEVSVDKLAVSQYEITFAEYEQFATATGRKIPDNMYMPKDTHPVIFVSWDDAFYYTKWLSEQTGERYRLLSEAEWEYMHSAGKQATFWWGFDEEQKRAHCFGCGTGLDPRKPTKIGSFEPNAFGLYDTAGNVSEWVRDCWHENYSGAPSTGEVWEGGDCAYRVVRGGGYSSPMQSLRNAKRDKFKSDQKYDSIGIRVAREMR